MVAIPVILKNGCLVLVAVVVLLFLAIAGLVMFGKKPDPFEKRLAELSPDERKTLDEVVTAAGIPIADLRDVFPDAPLDDERNLRSISIFGGHVRVLSLQRATGALPSSAALPSLSAWSELERLSLRGSGIAEIPAMEGCTHLKHLDVSKNQIAAVKPGTLPVGLEMIDLSENPISDLSALAVLKAPREIHAQHTKVSAFEGLLGLPGAPLLDLRGCPVERLPERFPSSPDFRVDLEGCPVASPPGYLKECSFKIRESGVVGGEQWQKGFIGNGKCDVSGTWKIVPQLTTVSLATPKDMVGGPGTVNLEAAVESGRLRVYLTAPGEVRGPWFEKGYVKGAGGFIQSVAMLYEDAEPGKPVRLRGGLERTANLDCYFYIEPQAGEPVRGLSYRVWR